ncbi:MAG: hypothetical protein JEZ07_12615 [Phycisphaerae bacterium]|nr:hypothetical protein [Phycisphaerae bacterium]
MILKTNDIKVKYKNFTLPVIPDHPYSAVIPAVKGVPFFKYGKHAYYFLNFKTAQGTCLTINHKDIIKPGLTTFFKANPNINNNFSKLKSLFQKYHYGFNFLEQIMLTTVPHGVTSIGNGRFFINLWSYCGYLDIDCKSRSVKYITIDQNKNNFVLGAQQFYDALNDELYYMDFSLRDSLKRINNPDHPVSCHIYKKHTQTGKTEKIWTGNFADYLHEIIINKTRQYCVVCEMGMYTDNQNEIIPSKVLVLDLHNNKSWEIAKFIVAAHAQFDPDQADIVYFSNHNFNFKHSSFFKLLKNSTYDVKFRGPASVYKYRLTANGPVEIGYFTHPELFRLTNSHVFNHRKQKLLAVIGYPNYIFIADAESMIFIKKIEINPPWPIGTIAASPDGEKLYVQTTKTFQIIDIASHQPDINMDHRYNHSCANHMIASNDTNW